MVRKLQAWFAAALAGITLTLLLPAQAWAADNPATAELVLEAARKSKRGGGAMIFGLLCCVGVIAVIVIAFVLFSRKRKRR